MQTKNRLFSIISAVLVIITLLFDINSFFQLGEDFFYFLFSDYGIRRIISFIVNIFLVSILFMDNRKLAIIPYSLKIVIGLIDVAWASSVYTILELIIEVAMLFIILSSTVLCDKIDKKILKYIWFVPAVIWFVILIIDYAKVEYFSFSLFVWLRFQYIIILLSYLSIGVWASDIYVPKGIVNKNKNYATPEFAPNANGYCGLVTHILLLLFTFGIWQYIWIYKTTSYLNNTPNEEQRNPTTKLLLCMFVPFYYIYWTYKSAQRIDKFAISKGQQSDISALCLILSIFIGIVPPIIMQDKINNIVKPKNNVNITTKTDTTPTSTTNSSIIGVADEIKKYKDLLDVGIITQEEFETKKKKLLDL